MHNLKLLTAVFAALSVSSSVVYADALTDITARGTVVCGVIGDTPPFSSLNAETRELEGLEIDYCNAVGQHLGVAVEIKPVTAASRVPELAQGRVDVLIAQLNYTPERALQVNYTDVYFSEGSSFIVNPEFGVEAVEDLSGQRIGSIKGSTLEPVIDTLFPDTTRVSYDNKAAQILAVQQGKVAALLSRTSMMRAMQLDFESEGIAMGMVAAPTVPRQVAGIAVRKGETTLVQSINVMLDEMEASGEAQTIFDKWFGANSPLGLTKDFVVGEPPVQ